MSAGQSSGAGAKTVLRDGKVKKDEILRNRDKSQRRPGEGLDGKGVQIKEYKDIPTNRRGPTDHGSKSDSKPEAPDSSSAKKKIDRPGFDLGGASGKTEGGRGLGLGDDAKEARKGQRLPRQSN